MKLPALFVVLAFICSTGFTLAAPTSSSNPSVTNPQVHQINMRLRAQMRLVQQGFKSGKLTKDQAASLRTDLKSVRQQEMAFFKQNGKKDLTTNQQTQLDQALDINETSIPT
ncbi:MAG TPA: hypothetical protein VIJ93_08925 [bacterium]